MTMRIIRTLVLVATCVVLLPTATPVHAASCKGASHEMTLTRGVASPSTGTSATPIRFSAVYTDNNDCPPISITVTVSGVGTFPLAEVGSDPSGGITYARTMPLPVGFRTYYFSATSGEGAGEVTVQLTSVSPSSLTITAPPPPPTPAPTPRPPAPTPRPTPVPTPVPSPKPPAPTPTPTPPPAPASTPVPATPAPSVTEPGGEEPSPSADTGSSSPDPSRAPSAMPEPSDVPAASENDGAPVLPGGGSRDPDSAGGLGGPASRAPDWLLPWVLLGTVSGGLFFVLARRRHTDEPPPTTITATATATAAAVTAVSAEGPVPAVTPLPPMRELIPPVNPDLLRDADDDPRAREDEADIPRWLRPSVRQARFQGSRYTRNDNWD
jgi:hypothetical protein